jgi:hypothetical protein
MVLSAAFVLVAAQLSSDVLEELMNYPVYMTEIPTKARGKILWA